MTWSSAQSPSFFQTDGVQYCSVYHRHCIHVTSLYPCDVTVLYEHHVQMSLRYILGIPFVISSDVLIGLVLFCLFFMAF